MSTSYYNIALSSIDSNGNPCIVYPKTKTSNVYNTSGQSLDTIITNLNTAISSKAASSHFHDDTYLQLSGGTMTGTLQVGDNAILSPNSNFYLNSGTIDALYTNSIRLDDETTRGEVGEHSFPFDVYTTDVSDINSSTSTYRSVNWGQNVSYMNDGNKKDHFHVFDALGISTGNSIITFGTDGIIQVPPGGTTLPISHNYTGFRFLAQKNTMYLVSLTIVQYTLSSGIYAAHAKYNWIGYAYWNAYPAVGMSAPYCNMLHNHGVYNDGSTLNDMVTISADAPTSSRSMSVPSGEIWFYITQLTSTALTYLWCSGKYSSTYGIAIPLN